MTATSFFPETPVVPYCIGPTWRRTPEGAWDLPEFTLGWEIIAWIPDNLLLDGEPIMLTDEQIRFLLWMYAVDHRGRFLYRDIVLQRMKGWGKDPIAAIVAAVEFVGPCRFDYWGEDGQPVARDEPNAWVQIAAVSSEQTKNTVTMLMGIFSPACKAEHGIDVGKEKTYAYQGQRRIEITSTSPKTLEGNRPTFVIRNETHHWGPTNDGIEMHKVIRRNLAKGKGGQNRGLSITNAYSSAEDSVAKRQREAYFAKEEGRARFATTTVLYDSLEAPKSATLFPEFTRWGPSGEEIVDRMADGKTKVPPSLEVVQHHLKRMIEAVRGDAVWLDPERLIEEILDPDQSVEESKRFYMNSVALGDDDAFKPEDIKATAHPVAQRLRNENREGDPVRIPWAMIDPEEPIAVFGDGSKSDDSTGLVACRLSDGFLFTLGVWQKPPGERGRGWLAPRDEIDSRVTEVFGRFNVVAFWFDPSHTKDDNDATRYWDGLIDDWHQRYGDRLQYWAMNSGDRRSSIAWDMTSPTRQVDFVMAVERFTDEIESHALTHDAHPALLDHLKNAKSRMTTAGWSVAKESRSSKKKIDLAVCAIGARMLRRVVLNKGLEVGDVPAKVWW